MVDKTADEEDPRRVGLCQAMLDADEEALVSAGSTYRCTVALHQAHSTHKVLTRHSGILHMSLGYSYMPI